MANNNGIWMEQIRNEKAQRKLAKNVDYMKVPKSDAIYGFKPEYMKMQAETTKVHKQQQENVEPNSGDNFELYKAPESF